MKLSPLTYEPMADVIDRFFRLFVFKRKNLGILDSGKRHQSL